MWWIFLKLQVMSAPKVKQWKQKESVNPFMQETSVHPTITKIRNRSTWPYIFKHPSLLLLKLLLHVAHCVFVFKNNFIAGLCSTNRDFPLHLWEKLLPQCLLTLNLLRRSRINPQLSAQAHMHGAFNFNRTPLASPGTKVLIHEKPDT
jgi:hypothetical protein